MTQKDIFNVCPFYIKRKRGIETISINHFNVLRNILSGSKTFGESHNLKKLISSHVTEEGFNALKSLKADVVVTVSNLSLNQVEYKSVKDFDYEDFLEWVWISCNYTPFMSLVKKDGCEYADGGLG